MFVCLFRFCYCWHHARQRVTTRIIDLEWFSMGDRGRGLGGGGARRTSQAIWLTVRDWNSATAATRFERSLIKRKRFANDRLVALRGAVDLVNVDERWPTSTPRMRTHASGPPAWRRHRRARRANHDQVSAIKVALSNVVDLRVRPHCHALVLRVPHYALIHSRTSQYEYGTVQVGTSS